VDLVRGLFFLPLAVYALGMLCAKLIVPRVPALEKWLKHMQQKNIPLSVYLLSQSYRRRVWFIGTGNLVFGFLLVASGVVLGLPPLFLLFRSSVTTWGITHSHSVTMGLKQIRLPYRALMLLEVVIFSVWAGLGVELGLFLVASVSGWSEIVTQQRSLLGVLPWLILAVLVLLIFCAAIEGYTMGTMKEAILRAIFQEEPQVTNQSGTALTTRPNVPAARSD
jgi:hypothetical protein